MKKFFFSYFLKSFILVYFQTFICGNASSQEKLLPRVKATEVVSFMMNDKLSITGSIVANEQVEITSVVSEKIKKINFREGSFIKKNSILVEFENAEELAVLKQIKAELEESNLNFSRAIKLLGEGNTSQAIVDKRTKEKTRLEGKVEEINAKIDDLVIKAPFDGIIGTKNFSEGSFIVPGQIIANFYDIEKVKIKIFLPEKYINKIKLNQSIQAKISANNLVIKGNVYAIDPFIDSKTRTFAVIAIVEQNTDLILKPGMMVNVDIFFDSQNVLSIPEGSLVPEGSQNYVFVVDKLNKVKKKKIKIGNRKKGIIEVIGGLKENELVVYEGTNKIKSGLEIELIK